MNKFAKRSTLYKDAVQIMLRTQVEMQFRIYGGCWSWPGSKSERGGHGVIILRDFENGVTYHFYVHRMSYERNVGRIPSGMVVMHNCPSGDLADCFNWSHLRLGTKQDNARDMAAKGRQWKQAGLAASVDVRKGRTERGASGAPVGKGER